MKKVCVLVKSCTYGMASPGEAYRAIIGLAGMDVDTSAVLVDDGVFAAIKGQDPSVIEMQSLELAYKSIGEFGAKLYIHKESMEKRGIKKDEIIEANMLDTDALRKMINEADAVITFT